MKKVFYGVIAVIVIAALFGGCHEQSDLNRLGSSIDWGDGYYWDSSTESVQKTWNNWD